MGRSSKHDDDGFDAPMAEKMERDVHADPVRELAMLSVDDMKRIKDMDMHKLSAFFSEELGLKELPELIVRNSLNGAVLGTISPDDIARMDFHSLGEAKGFQALCHKMSQMDRGTQREERLDERKLTFWGLVDQWNPGPCSGCNCTAMKHERNCCQYCGDRLTCTQLKEENLPMPWIEVFRDHLAIHTPTWNEKVVSKEYHKLNRAFVDPNVEAYKVHINNVDFSTIVDVNVEKVEALGEYVWSCADCKHKMCCRSLRREPYRGNYYWISCCQKCCGYNRRFKERPDGLIEIILARHDSVGSIGSEKDNILQFGVVEDVHDFQKALLSYIEEAQITKGLRVNIH